MSEAAPLPPAPADEVTRLQRRLDRERRARLEAEATAERGLRTLFERQRQLELTQAVATAANEAVGTDAALQITLQLLCEFTGWPVGHAFLPTSSGTELVSSGLWHLAHPERHAEFRAVSAAARFAPGVGLPGRVWRKGRAVWVVDVTQDANFPRATAAKCCGLRGAIAFPVKTGQKVCAVLEFFTPVVAEPDESLMDIFTQIGTLLGRVFERVEAAAALQHARGQLEERVRERTAELNRAHADITASEQRYRLVLDQLGEVVFQTDALGAWKLLNPAWERLLGHSVVESLGRPHTEYLHPDDVEGCQQICAQLFANAVPQCRGTVRFRTHDGSMRLMEIHASPLRDATGGCVGIAGTLADITERHQAEIALRSANDQLARAGRLKDEFLAAMSHELRTPLNAVLGFSEVLLDGVHGELNEKQARALTNIQESGRHLLALINDILDLSKIEAGKERLHLDTVQVDTLCQTSLQFVRTEAAKKTLRLLLEVEPTVETLHGDERRLRQVLVNLLTNAVKFTPEGGTVGLRAQRAPDEPAILLTVWDTGIGISSEDQAKLFQPFVQLDSKLSRQYNGTGLGLSLVLRLTEMHGGRITLESAVGQGSRFIIRLPTQPNTPTALTSAASAAPALPALPGPGAAPAQRPVVLLAEDNPMNRETIVTYLTAKGFRVVIAENGEQAIQQAQAVKPGVILMDIQMPGMDGLEATGILKSRPDTARTPIIALTALAMTGDRERCLAAGADDYLSKPVNLRELVTTIQHHLEQKP
jgi:PAS domain S-box-containing protein